MGGGEYSGKRTKKKKRRIKENPPYLAMKNFSRAPRRSGGFSPILERILSTIIPHSLGSERGKGPFSTLLKKGRGNRLFSQGSGRRIDVRKKGGLPFLHLINGIFPGSEKRKKGGKGEVLPHLCQRLGTRT